MASRLAAFLRIIRPVNCVMMGIAVVLSELVALQGFPDIYTLILGFVTAFALTAASMVVNDYFDFQVDLVNAPWRPLPSGLIRRNEAILYAVFFAIVGVVASFQLNFECLVLAVASLIISTIYNAEGKKFGLLGNFMVSFCVALPFLYGSFAVKSGGSLLLQILSLAAFLANTGREVTKGIIDVEGDRVRGVKTIAISRGKQFAGKLSSLFYLSAVAIGFAPILLGLVWWIYLPFFALSAAGFLIDSLRLARSPTELTARAVKKRILLYMLLAMVATFLGGFKGLIS
ncbi:MAG: UbiA family prenyltransferase [archaeon GB-1867-005]|nr:UbiA family prenyltransferase [Candidatus Culexmicrobium cathedralense]